MSSKDDDKEAQSIEESLLPAGGESDVSEIPTAGWRRDLLKLLTSKKCEMLLLALLALDVIAVIVELELNTRKVCAIEWTEGEYVIPKGGVYATEIRCAEAPKLDHFTCDHRRNFTLPAGFEPCPFTVKEELPHNLETGELFVAWFSRGIIFIFVIELFMLLLAGGPKLFWHHKMYLLDAIIVGVAFIIECVSITVHIEALAELIVIARCWRFARVIHGVGAGVHEQGKEHKEGGAGGDKEEKEMEGSGGGIGLSAAASVTDDSKHQQESGGAAAAAPPAAAVTVSPRQVADTS